MPMSFEVVGLVRDVKSSGLNRPAEPAFYVPARQMPTPEMNLLVRTAGGPLGFVGAVRNAVWQIDPNQPVSGVSTMEHIVSDSIAQPRLGMALMGLFGLIAMTLASIGIYGLLSYTVRQRAPEIGIRMALGSRQTDILKLVVIDGLGLALAGTGIGLAASFGLTRFLSSELFGVAPTDPTTFILVAVILTLVALSASYLPARRAAQVDPMIALRDN
jgi:putative ABC transport system permease protein